jgi:hypothetical protein
MADPPITSVTYYFATLSAQTADISYHLFCNVPRGRNTKLKVRIPASFSRFPHTPDCSSVCRSPSRSGQALSWPWLIRLPIAHFLLDSFDDPGWQSAQKLIANHARKLAQIRIRSFIPTRHDLRSSTLVLLLYRQGKQNSVDRRFPALGRAFVLVEQEG